MVKDWDKSKQETNPGNNSMRKKKSKDEGRFLEDLPQSTQSTV